MSRSVSKCLLMRGNNRLISQAIYSISIKVMTQLNCPCHLDTFDDLPDIYFYLIGVLKLCANYSNLLEARVFRADTSHEFGLAPFWPLKLHHLWISFKLYSEVSIKCDQSQKLSIGKSNSAPKLKAVFKRTELNLKKISVQFWNWVESREYILKEFTISFQHCFTELKPQLLSWTERFRVVIRCSHVPSHLVNVPTIENCMRVLFQSMNFIRFAFFSVAK